MATHSARSLDSVPVTLTIGSLSFNWPQLVGPLPPTLTVPGQVTFTVEDDRGTNQGFVAAVSCTGASVGAPCLSGSLAPGGNGDQIMANQVSVSAPATVTVVPLSGTVGAGVSITATGQTLDVAQPVAGECPAAGAGDGLYEIIVPLTLNLAGQQVEYATLPQSWTGSVQVDLALGPAPGGIPTDCGTSIPTATPSSTPTSTPTDTPTSSPTVTAGLMVSPVSGTVGQTFTLTGTHFNPIETVKIYVDRVTSTPAYTATTNAAGMFVRTATLKQGTFGPHALIAVGQSSEQRAHADYSLGAALRLAPASGSAASQVMAKGTGFGASEAITLRWMKATGKILSAGSSTRLGTATLGFAVPRVGRGTYTVYALGTSTRAWATATFTVN